MNTTIINIIKDIFMNIHSNICTNISRNIWIDLFLSFGQKREILIYRLAKSHFNVRFWTEDDNCDTTPPSPYPC